MTSIEQVKMTSTSSAKLHSPAQQYTFRVPSPPRIIVLPPCLDQHGIPSLQLVGDASIDYESSGFSNVEFLRTVTHGNLITANNMLEWKYEQRRAAQKIVPFLYLGPITAAKDRLFLQTEGITMVLAVRNTQSAMIRLFEPRVAYELGLDVSFIDVNGNLELIAAFPKGIEIINAHLSKMYRLQQACTAHSVVNPGDSDGRAPGKVLVFCETGNERSATMVAAYMMAMYSKDLRTVLQIIQAQRFCVAYDDPLRNLLQTYESILKAKRDVHQAAGSRYAVRNKATGILVQTGKSTKRSFDEAQEGNMEIDEEENDGQMDASRFENREGLAPFQN